MFLMKNYLPFLENNASGARPPLMSKLHPASIQIYRDGERHSFIAAHHIAVNASTKLGNTDDPRI